MPPLIMNVVKGLRYCGKKGSYSLREMARPLKESTGGYACPAGYQPCNENFLKVSGGEDYVVCIGAMEDPQLSCPITSLAFEPPQENASMYEKRLVVS